MLLVVTVVAVDFWGIYGQWVRSLIELRSALVADETALSHMPEEVHGLATCALTLVSLDDVWNWAEGTVESARRGFAARARAESAARAAKPISPEKSPMAKMAFRNRRKVPSEKLVEATRLRLASMTCSILNPARTAARCSSADLPFKEKVDMQWSKEMIKC